MDVQHRWSPVRWLGASAVSLALVVGLCPSLAFAANGAELAGASASGLAVAEIAPNSGADAKVATQALSPAVAAQAVDSANVEVAADDSFTMDGITYGIIDKDALKVQVGVGKGYSYGKNALDLSVVGNTVSIPATVSHDGKTYTVVQVSKGALGSLGANVTINLPDTIQTICENAFRWGKFASITLPEGLKVIEAGAFVGDSDEFGSYGLTSVAFPSTLEMIGEGAFQGDPLKSVKFNEGLKSIGKSAFGYCAQLTKIELPASLLEIGDQAFMNCEAAVRVSIADGSQLTSVGESAFMWDSKIASVNLPASITTIGKSAFSHCDKLAMTGLEGATALTSVGDSAFSYTSISKMHVPATCADFSTNAIANCPKLAEIVVEEGHPAYKTQDGLLYTADGTQLLLCPGAKPGTVEVAAGTQEIAAGAFASTPNLEKIVIPDGVTTLGVSVFKDTGVKEVVLPDSVTTAGRLLFYNCENLATVNVPAGLASVPEYLFYNCTALESVEFPATCVAFGSNVISSNDSALTSVAINAQTATMQSSSFPSSMTDVRYTTDTDAVMNTLIEVCGIAEGQITSNHNDPIPDLAEFTSDALVDADGNGVYCKVLTAPSDDKHGMVALGRGESSYYGEFQAAEGATDLVIPAQVTDEYGRAYDVVQIAPYFAGGSYAAWASNPLTSISVPATVQVIAEHAFERQSSAKSVTFAEGSTLKSIGESAFQDCSALTSVALPAGVATIGDKAFAGCTGLASIDVAAGNKSFKSVDGVLLSGDGASIVIYPSGSDATSYTVPDSVTAIPDELFKDNKTLKSVTIGAGCKSIGVKAFSGMSKLDSVVINSAETIGNMAFYNSRELSSVTLPENLLAIDKNAFYFCSNLASISIPKNVTSIGDSAFYGTGIADISISSTDISSPQLAASICSNGMKGATDASFKVATQEIKDALVKAGVPEDSVAVDASLLEQPTQFAEFAVDGLDYKVTVAAADRETAGCATVAKANGAGGDVVIPEQVEFNGWKFTVTEIGNGAFYADNDVTSVVVPASVTKVGVNGLAAMSKLERLEFAEGSQLVELGNGAISDDHMLAELMIPASVKSFGTFVFAWNYGLETLTFADGSTWESIPDGLVFRDGKLKNLTLPTGATEVGDEAFYNCASLPAFDFEGIARIGEAAFMGCAALTEIEIPEGVQAIENGTFKECAGLTKVTLPSTLAAIGNPENADPEEGVQGAFEGCTSLTAIVIPENVTAINQNAFANCENLASIDVRAKALSEVAGNAFVGIYGGAVFTAASSAAGQALVQAGINASSIKAPRALTEAMVPDIAAQTYTGKALEPAVKVLDGDKELVAGADYTVAFASNTNAGEAMVTITGIGDYDGAVAKAFTIAKAPQSISAKAKVVKKLKAKKKKLAKKTSIDLKGLAKVTAQTEVMYKKANKAGGKKITVNAKTGKVTVKKGLKKGAYKVKVKLTAAGDANHVAPAAKTVTLVVKVK